MVPTNKHMHKQLARCQRRLVARHVWRSASRSKLLTGQLCGIRLPVTPSRQRGCSRWCGRGQPSLGRTMLSGIGANDDYLCDQDAATSAGPRCSRLTTWSTMLCEFDGELVPWIAIELEDIMCVGGIIKAKRYRLYGNYLSDVSAEHIRAEHEWTRRWLKKRCSA